MVAATKIDLVYQFPAFLADGVMGFGLKGISNIGANTWFENAFASNVLQAGEEKVFGMVLSPSGTGPKFIFGGRDTSKFVGSLTYIGLPSNAVRILRGVPCLCLFINNMDAIQNFWEIALDSVTVNGNDIKIAVKEVVIDSSSTFVVANSGDIANLYSNIPGSAPDSTNPFGYTSTHVPVLLLEQLTRFT